MAILSSKIYENVVHDARASGHGQRVRWMIQSAWIFKVFFFWFFSEKAYLRFPRYSDNASKSTKVHLSSQASLPMFFPQDLIHYLHLSLFSHFPGSALTRFDPLKYINSNTTLSSRVALSPSLSRCISYIVAVLVLTCQEMPCPSSNSN